jgi:hypothetical protein
MHPRIARPPGRPCTLLLATVLVSALATGAATRAHAEEAEAADVVRLAFGWEAGMDARVETVKTRARSQPDGTTTGTELRIDYRLRTTYGNLARLRVAHESLTFETGEYTDAASTTRDLAQVTPLAADFEVDGDGAFLSIVDARAATTRLREALDALLDASGSPRTVDHERSLANLGNERVLSARASERWSSLVQTWVGRELAVGEFFEASGTTPHPMLPSASVGLTYLFGISERTGCTDPEGPPDCVELRLITELDAEDVRRTTRTIIEQEDPARLPPGIETMELSSRTDVTIVADPATLRPYYYEHRRVIEAGQPGALQRQEEVEQTLFRYAEG